MGLTIFNLKSNLKRFLFCPALMVIFCIFAVAQDQYYSWDFSDCDLKDILYAISLDSGISIIADDTVSGKGDLRFTGKDFGAAFESFLRGNRLYVKQEKELWIVSKFFFEKRDDLLRLDVCDMQPNQILEKLSSEMKTVLTFDSLPSQKISLHFDGLAEDVLIDALGKSFGSYVISRTGSGYHFSKKVDSRRSESVDGLCQIEKRNDGFYVDVRECKFSDVVEKLFLTDGGERNFCMLGNGDSKLQRSVFNGNDFTDTLAKLCGQSGNAFAFVDNCYYFYADSESKKELISGDRSWKKFSLNYIKPQDFFPLLSKSVGKLESIYLPDDSGFLCFSNKEEGEKIEELISSVDLYQKTYLVNLKYIKPSDFMNHLPPSVDKSNLFLAEDGCSLYFKGSESAYEKLKEELLLCDRPVKRLSYDLLILQYDESGQNQWSSSLGVDRLKMGDRNSLLAQLGSVLNLNLNVVTAFGLSFALDLQNSIEENRTKVFADTTLHGVSGKKIDFQNTNTYRYRDNNIDPDTGLPIYSGVTREISSGIKLEILGWVSGDGMITSTVTASVSRQGTDTSASTGNPPPTSEKIVTTEVRGKSGEVLVLSGLIQKSDTEEEKRTPFVSKIPLVGNLFKAKEKTRESSQMVIYLVPHLEEEEKAENKKVYDKKWKENRMKRFMERWINKMT